MRASFGISRSGATLQDQVARTGRIEVLDQLSGGLAHNFNNLLAIVLGNAEMIRVSSHDPAEVKRLAEVIEQAATRGADLTSRMMSFTSQSLSSDIMPVQVNELIREVKPMIDTSLTSDITLELDLAEGLPDVDSSRGEFEDAVINLVLNARDAIRGGGTVNITTRKVNVSSAWIANNPEFKGGECVAVDVEDNGVGVPAALLDKIIEPFFTTKSQDSGTGLGLSTVYGFARRIGGDIEIRSTEGVGTRVTLLLPRSTKRADTSPPEKPAPIRSSSARERTLIVEDEALASRTQRKAAAAAGLHGVLGGVRRRRSRRSRHADEPVDLVFSDIVMPGGVDGIDLIDIVRELRPGTPIVLCTGYAESHAERAHEKSVKVLHKPFNARTEWSPRFARNWTVSPLRSDSRQPFGSLPGPSHDYNRVLIV
ncbi:MAG: ATP-binding protein [Gammaproteobacteria bacterium]|nr:ATP-binding protein [Gammaproteobacteria bacterium]